MRLGLNGVELVCLVTSSSAGYKEKSAHWQTVRVVEKTRALNGHNYRRACRTYAKCEYLIPSFK